MANRSTHALIGGATGLFVALHDNEKSHEISHHPIVATGAGVFFGRLPDILEPSLNNPHHRQFYHSIVAFSAIAYGMKKAHEWRPTNNFEKFLRGIALVAGVTYLSHLTVDAFSPRSLPIFGKL